MTMWLALPAITASTLAQHQYGAEQYNSTTNSTIQHSLPVERCVAGGTKITVDFNGYWEADQKEAFLTACRIWEEVMPTTFPIRVLATMNAEDSTNNAGDTDLLSEVSFSCREEVPVDCWTMYAPNTQPKAIVFDKLCNLGVSSYWKYVLDSSYFDIYDIEITIYKYKNMDDIYSYDRNGTSVTGKFDFATTVMRHIGTGLGLSWSHRHASNGSLAVDTSSLTPYEAVIADSLVYGVGYDMSAWFQKATQGALTINGGQMDYTLYAPQTWSPVMSLNYFIPETSNKLSQLMRWDYARGMVMHDIFDNSTTYMFTDLLRWEPMIAIGIGNEPLGGSVSAGTTTNTQAIAPGGTISLSVPIGQNRLSSEPRDMASKQPILLRDSSTYEIMKLYHPNYYNGTINNYGWTVSVLKEDGTWEAVYHDDDDEAALQLDESDIVLSAPLPNYARSYDGHLRCRVTYKKENPNDNYVYCYYCLLKTLPQQVDASPTQCRTVAMVEGDEYSKVIKVRIGNLAGTARLFVGQLDDWATVPYYYEVTDFGKGYFEATVDVEYPTVFTIAAYDEYNRYTTKTITYTPDPDELGVDLNFKSNRNYIEIKPAHTRRGADELVLSGEIISISPENVTLPMWEQGKLEGNRIDISGLKQGMYALNVTDVKGKKHTYKFCK